MEDIRLYDFEFNLLHIENDIISAYWTLKYNDIGTFEAHFELGSDIVPILLNNPYIVAVQGDKQAIITGKQTFKDCAVFGRSVNWILTRRTVPKFKYTELPLPSKDAESIARYVVSQAFSDVENFVLGGTIGFSEQDAFWRNKTNPAFDVVKDCLDTVKAGHRVFFDVINKRWVFEVINGSLLDLIVSEANRNAYNTEYAEDLQDYYTEGWYEQEQEEVDGARPDPVWTKIEKDSSKSGIYRWETVLSGSVESEAKAALNAKVWEKKIQTKTRDILYGIDYRLGDIVKVQKQVGSFKATFEKQVIGVNLWYENNNVGEQPIFEEV